MGDGSDIANNGDENLELIAAGLRRDAEDTRLHGQVVLESLANALPPELARVERSGGLVRKSKVVGVHISVGDRRYVLKTTSVRPCVVGVPRIRWHRHEHHARRVRRMGS